MCRIFILLLLLCIGCATFAEEMFQQTDSNGNITYSDTQISPNGKKITVYSQNEMNISTPSSTNQESILKTNKPIPSNTSLPQSTNPLAQSHTLFSIISPQDQETIYNQPVIVIDIKIEPKLNEGERIQILLDGAPTGIPVASTRTQLENIDRGTHQISALLLNKNNQVIKRSEPITIYVHHTSIRNILTSPRG